MHVEQLQRFTYAHLEPLAIGAGILGTGGGGSPYLSKLVVGKLLKNGFEVPVVRLSDVPDDALVASTGGIGAPTVGVERMSEGREMFRSLRALEHHVGRPATHMIAAEIGGGNALAPIKVAIQAGLPVVDGDAMGRAFPELQMDTFCIYGIPPTPCAISDVRGHVSIFDNISDARDLERYARQVTVQMGGGAGAAGPLITGVDVRRTAIPGTLTFAVLLGEAVLAARLDHRDPVEAAIDLAGGVHLFGGKITDVDRRFVAGFSRGTLKLDGIGEDTGRTFAIDFQNENLVATDDQGTVISSVPDLICIVDAETAEPITTEMLRYGLRVAVIGIPAPHLISTPEALEVVGPAAFGYPDVEYVPLPGVYGGKLAELVSNQSGAATI